MSDRPIGVLGGGAWGTALAVVLAGRGRSVRLWMRDENLVARMLARRDNPVHLPGVRVPEGVVPVHDVSAALEDAGLVIVAVPSQFARAVYERVRPTLGSGTPLAIAAKGIETGTLALPAAVAREVLGEAPPISILSGPSFASEVARGLPTGIVVASANESLAKTVQDLFSGSCLRVYTNSDPTGVQLAGALKNVIAIAAGVADGAGMGSGAVAALITRGLGEMRRLGVACGGSPETFGGLAGLGDLVLTCTGDLSRNRKVGRALGRGERLCDVLAHTASVAEGVATARAARALARRQEVATPIVDEVCRLLDEEGSVQEGLARLMSRPLKSEGSEEPARTASQS